MNVSNMLSTQPVDPSNSPDFKKQNHQYPTRHASSSNIHENSPITYDGIKHRFGGPAGEGGSLSAYAQVSPSKKDLKHIVFQLIDPEDPRYQARLPMRVMISPHDITESIISTVKNFYGLYECGVSFEDKEGISIIAHYDNFYNNMTVYVRTVAQPPAPLAEHVRESASPKRLALGPAIEMRPPSFSSVQSPGRSAVRSVGARSMSPQSEAERRNDSVSSSTKARSYKTKPKEKSVNGDAEGYSSGDNDQDSVTSSRRSKAEEIKADITVDNIVEGGRRKRAFESSELPLFVPPQVPISASISSISPQRRSGPLTSGSPFAQSNQQTFSYTQPLPSPQSYATNNLYAPPKFPANPYHNNFQPPSRHLRGSRVSGASLGPHRASNGILPTPDPTVGSVISDEDVALQLMRLGDPTAFSHGRTSTSTADDALSGKAEVASSDDEEEDDEDEEAHLPGAARYSQGDYGPQRKKQRLMAEFPSDPTSGEEYEDYRDGTFRGDAGDITIGHDGHRIIGKPKHKGRAGSAGAFGKMGKPRALSMSKVKKTSMGGKVPVSPASLPTQSRKASISSTINFQHQLGDDEEDLSSKPRCQRCRKSKKGCDRQRPCGRCKDAGIGIEGCVSEDEGNGRKGRYGRHMGVTVKKAEETLVEDMSPAQITSAPSSNGVFLAPALPDKANKKRKR